MIFLWHKWKNNSCKINCKFMKGQWKENGELKWNSKLNGLKSSTLVYKYMCTFLIKQYAINIHILKYTSS